MNGFRAALSRVQGFFGRVHHDADLDEELGTHLHLLTRDYVRRGLSPDEAHYAAQRELGDIAPMKEAYRDRRGIPFLESILQDIRFAVRGLRRSPVFTLVAVSSLALGIGANTAIFSFVNAVLLTHLSVPHPERLVLLHRYENGQEVSSPFSYPLVNEIAKRNRVFDGVFGRFLITVSLQSGDGAQMLSGEIVTGDYFRTLQVLPALGRLMNDEDVRNAPGNPVCVISYALWQGQFGGNPDILHRTILLNNRAYRILGVTEPKFFGSELQRRIELQVPVSRLGDFMPSFQSGNGLSWNSYGFAWLQTLGRLKPDLSATQAQAMLQPVMQQIRLDLSHSPANTHDDAKSQTRLEDGSQGFDRARSTFGTPVSVLMGVVVLVLLGACANLANLLLARAGARESEFAIRLSLGASRWRLMRQLMIESLVLAGAGGIFGSLLSLWVTDTMLYFFNQGRSPQTAWHIQPDATVFGFAAGLSVLTAFAFGLVPAWQSARRDRVQARQNDSSLRPPPALLRRSLIVCQLAISLVVLFAAGLLSRTLAALQTADLGFQPSQVILLDVHPELNGYSLTALDRLYAEILQRARALPDVAEASLATVAPLGDDGISMSVEVPGPTPIVNDPPNFNFVSPRYFATLQQPLIAGRDFDERDSENSPRVALVNEEFVKRYMPGQSAVGRQFKHGSPVEIIGVVKNARYASVREDPYPAVYLSSKQGKGTGPTLLVRANGNAATTIPLLTSLVRNLDPKLAVEARTLNSQIDGGLSNERILSFLSAMFSGLATLLSAIGLYGMIAYSVSRRTKEIGIRFAVGASLLDVARIFVQESVLLLSFGIAVGIPLALLFTRLLKSVLYGLSSTDAATLVITVALLTISGLLATLLPLSGAMRVDPVEALRHQ